MSKLVMAAVLGLALGMSGSGCASDSKRVVVDERVQTVEPSVGQARQVSTVARTTTTVRSQPDEPRGLLSTTVHFIGELLALPFRLLGGLLRALF